MKDPSICHVSTYVPHQRVKYARSCRAASSKLICHQRLGTHALCAPTCAFGRRALLAECKVGMLWPRCCLTTEKRSRSQALHHEAMQIANSNIIGHQRFGTRALRTPTCAFGRWAPLGECRVGMLCAFRWPRCCLKAEMADTAEPQPSGAPGSNADPGRSCEAFCSPTARVHKAEGAQIASLELVK